MSQLLDNNGNISSLNWTITLHQTPESGNVLMRMHWAKYQDTLGRWKHDVWALCKEAGIPKCARIKVNVKIYYRTRAPRDEDNFEFGLKKLLGDSLKGVVIPDDSPEYLEWGTIQHLHDKHSPRIEVIISAH